MTLHRMTPYRSAVFALLGCLLASATAAQSRNSQRVLVQDQEGREVGWYGRSYALVIGVSAYTAGWPELPNVPQELEEVRQELRTHGFEIVETPADATADELKNSFRAFFAAYGNNPRNRLLVFFSGHGYTLGPRERSFLVPSDAPDPLTDRAGFLGKALPTTRMIAWSRKVNASNVLFLFESCFSPASLFQAQPASDVPPPITDATTRPVRQFISACSAGEQTPAKSIFVPHFARALRGEADLNDDHYVTGTELGKYLHQAVSADHSEQTPQYGKILDPDLKEGDFVFRLPKGQIGQGTAEAPLVGPAPVGPAATELLTVRVLKPKGGTSVRIKGDGEFAYATFWLENPLRFVVDLPGVVNKAGTIEIPVASTELSQIRTGQFKSQPDPISRVVFNLNHWSQPILKRGARALVVWFPPRTTIVN